MSLPSTISADESAAERLQDPNRLMKPARLAALAPSRLSASRSLVNLMSKQRWNIERVRFDIDDRSRGRAVYRVEVGAWVFSFMVFSFEPVLEGRTGRIIGSNWDMMGSLVEGEPSEEVLDATEREMPKLYAGRATPGTLVWCRSNRSLRVFDHVIDALAEGKQPDADELWSVGYLMRNTGLDGNGTFGTRSFLALEEDHPLRAPYHAQMLAAYFMREFAFDLVEHLARVRNPAACSLDAAGKRLLGLGNGSAMGLVFFVNTHPALINRWLSLRQDAIAHAAAQPLAPGSTTSEHVKHLLRRAARYYDQDPFVYRAFEDPRDVGQGLALARQELDTLLANGPTTGADLLEALDSQVSPEAWEVVASVLLEVDTDYADSALERGAVSEEFLGDPAMPVGRLRDILQSDYAWALSIDMSQPGARHYVWYKSRDAEEPRRGPADEVTEGRNWALDLPTDVQALMSALDTQPLGRPVGELLAERPDLRGTVERVQGLADGQFHSPHMNMLDKSFLPVHIVRFMNAAFHGLDRTIDFLDRGVLGLLFLGAPTRDDLKHGRAQDWLYPSKPTTPHDAIGGTK